MSLFSDDIADGVRAGRPDAVGEVYVHLASRLFGYLMARVRDRQAAEDLVEATFVELLEKGHTIRGGPEVIKAWLFRAAHFNSLDHLRKRNRSREDPYEDPTDHDTFDDDPGPEARAVSADIGRELRGYLTRLSEDQQQVLLLRYVGGLTAPEVAQILGKNVVAVRGLQHRGERSLHRLLMADRSPLTITSDVGEASKP
jgi:RNA polymerase sigma-70 factor (ECF subfamily)